MAREVGTCSAANSACKKAGEWQPALRPLAETAESAVRQIAMICSAAINATERDGKWQLVMCLLAAVSAGEKGVKRQLSLGLLADLAERMAEGTAHRNNVTRSAPSGA